ncbi:MAG: transporter ATP-binding protein [Rhizobacter sp.]|nr:transporter ATP-binding protein [Rhizobacter sp.]
MIPQALAAPAPSGAGAAPRALTVENLEVVYDDVVLVLRGVSLNVPAGQIVALLGANGSGKTTLLRALSGLLDMHDAEITRGSVTLDGADIGRLSPDAIVRRGMVQVLEGRRVFAELTVEENLRLGGYTRPGNAAEKLAEAYELFPVLAERRRQRAGYLSGGEQQMLALGRAMMAEPSYLLVDEPSLGLAPAMVDRIAELLLAINARGTAVLLVEQNAEMALSVSSHGYVLELGRIVMEASSERLRQDDDVREFYLGLNVEGRRSFREIKHYRRKKRWLS